jgi:hypothetical protein
VSGLVSSNLATELLARETSCTELDPAIGLVAPLAMLDLPAGNVCGNPTSLPPRVGLKSESVAVSAFWSAGPEIARSMNSADGGPPVGSDVTSPGRVFSGRGGLDAVEISTTGGRLVAPIPTQNPATIALTSRNAVHPFKLRRGRRSILCRGSSGRIASRLGPALLARAAGKSGGSSKVGALGRWLARCSGVSTPIKYCSSSIVSSMARVSAAGGGARRTALRALPAKRRSRAERDVLR